MKKEILQAVSLYEIVGFSGVLVLLWFDELFDLPRRLFGGVPTPINWIESIIESIFVIILGAFVVSMTVRHIRQIKYLEGFLPICAYCKKIRIDGIWIPFEQYISDHSDATFTHGYCPECAARHFDENDG